MTQPIQEPTPPRAISRLTWGENQLFRRPAPAAGSNDVPWARRTRPLTEANQLVTTGSYTDIDVTEDSNMGVGESGEPWFQPETSGGTPNGIIVMQDAFIIATAFVEWFDVVNATWFIWITHGGATAPWVTYNPQFAGQNVTTTRGAYTTHLRCEANDVIEAGVWQTTGGNRNIDAGFLEVAVLGTWTGDPP